MPFFLIAGVCRKFTKEESLEKSIQGAFLLECLCGYLEGANKHEQSLIPTSHRLDAILHIPGRLSIPLYG